MSDDFIKIPEFLGESKESNSRITACDFCVEIACETDAEFCGSSESCSGQGCVGGTCEGLSESCVSCESYCEDSCQDACEITTQKPKVGATVTITNITANSVTAKITINDATEIDLQVKDTVTGDWVWDGDFSIVRPVTTISLDGLAQNRQYSYYIVDDINGKSSTKYFTTLSGRPKNWVWTTDFYSGKHLPVHITNKTYVILPAYEWTEFQNRINEFRDYTGLPQFGFTNVSRGTHFTNTIWNEAVYAICSMTDNSYQNIRKFEADNGTVINASLFQSLANELNSIP